MDEEPLQAHLATQPVAATTLRPTTFADVLKRVGHKSQRMIGRTPAGEGSVNFIDTRDIAAVARVALLEEVIARSQRVYYLTGPRAWTMREVAAELSRLLKRPVIYHQRSVTEHHEALIAEGMSVLVADLLIGLDSLCRDSALAESTATIKELTGRTPRPLSVWLSENIRLFQ